MTKSLTTGFDVERLRKKLLQAGLKKQLIKTYSADFPEIKDLNSGQFWDHRFSQSGPPGEESANFPMTNDRNQLVAGSIAEEAEIIEKSPLPLNILNLGAGGGELEQAFARTTTRAHWTGTDITDRALKQLGREFAQTQPGQDAFEVKNYKTNFKFVKTRLENTPFPDNNFDVVCLLEVLEHISPRQTFAVLKEVKRVLKPSGMAIISVPINEGLEKMMPHNPNAHMRDYSRKLVKFELEHIGFKVKKVVALTAFSKFYQIKKLLNSILRLREPNNLIFWVSKSKF